MDCSVHLNCMLVDILHNKFGTLIYFSKQEHICTIVQLHEHKSKHRKTTVNWSLIS